MSWKRTKRARFAAIAKFRRQNLAEARAAHMDLMLYGTSATYWDGDRLKHIPFFDLYTDAMPKGVRVEILDAGPDQRAVTAIWYDELAKLHHAR